MQNRQHTDLHFQIDLFIIETEPFFILGFYQTSKKLAWNETVIIGCPCVFV